MYYYINVKMARNLECITDVRQEIPRWYRGASSDNRIGTNLFKYQNTDMCSNKHPYTLSRSRASRSCSTYI